MKAHQRFVMDTMKAIMFAPMVLTRTLVFHGFSGQKQQAEPLIQTSELSDASTQSPISDASPISPLEPIDAGKYKLDNDSMGSLISLELCLNLMHCNKECLGRALVITSAVDETRLYNFPVSVFIFIDEQMCKRFTAHCRK